MTQNGAKSSNVVPSFTGDISSNISTSVVSGIQNNPVNDGTVFDGAVLVFESTNKYNITFPAQPLIQNVTIVSSDYYIQQTDSILIIANSFTGSIYLPLSAPIGMIIRYANLNTGTVNGGRQPAGPRVKYQQGGYMADLYFSAGNFSTYDGIIWNHFQTIEYP